MVLDYIRCSLMDIDVLRRVDESRGVTIASPANPPRGCTQKEVSDCVVETRSNLRLEAIARGSALRSENVDLVDGDGADEVVTVVLRATIGIELKRFTSEDRLRTDVEPRSWKID